MSQVEKRGRGRPKKVSVENLAPEIVENIASLDEVVPVQVKTPKRPKRTKIGARRNILSLEAPSGYVGRWVVDADHGWRISQLMEIGYTFLEDRFLSVGDVVVSSNRQSSSIIARQVNRTGEIAYYMIIPQELYDSYQDEKQEIVDESERAIRKDIYKDGNYGRIHSESNNNEPEIL
jgi:hypothetical protein